MIAVGIEEVFVSKPARIPTPYYCTCTAVVKYRKTRGKGKNKRKKKAVRDEPCSTAPSLLGLCWIDQKERR
jgi:hypothetical protein